MATRFSLLFFIFWILICNHSCNLNKHINANYNYELICNGIGHEGSYLVKCFSYGTTFEKARNNVKKDVIHGALFKGIAGNSVKKCMAQSKICNVAYNENKDWFDNFFKNGDHLMYVSLINDGNVSSSDRIKVKGGYKVGFTVSIKSDELRKLMEKEGFAKKMNVFDN